MAIEEVWFSGRFSQTSINEFVNRSSALRSPTRRPTLSTVVSTLEQCLANRSSKFIYLFSQQLTRLLSTSLPSLMVSLSRASTRIQDIDANGDSAH